LTNMERLCQAVIKEFLGNDAFAPVRWAAARIDYDMNKQKRK